jgi:2-polyprenyl-3-methyl-5-hydroxy-6-metoxy-1,4-benzoquinol methylase
MVANESMADVRERSYRGGELDVFALAKNWKAYIKREISSFVSGDVLEVGAGIGGTTVALHEGTARHWICLEPDPVLGLRLKRRLLQCGTAPKSDVIIGSLRTFKQRSSFDCIVYIDVLEHIADDCGEVAAAARLVRKGGHIVVLAPAHQWLFSEFDKSIGHLRRYNKARLKALMPSGWIEKKLRYLDSIGVLLSFANVVVLRQAMPTPAQILRWDRVCVPASCVIDRLCRGAIGKSVLAVWCKG